MTPADQQRGLRTYLDEFDNQGCGDPPPPAVEYAAKKLPAPVPAGSGNAAKAVAVAGGALGAGNIAYRVIRFLPSLAPRCGGRFPRTWPSHEGGRDADRSERRADRRGRDPALDRVLPYHPAMGLAQSPAAAETIKQSMPSLVASNRAAFVADPTTVPDLRRSLEAHLTREFGDAAAGVLLAWLENDFVHDAADFEHYGNWYQFFARVRAGPGRWERLALPPAVREAARTRFAAAKDVGDLHDLERRIDDAPLSDWDRGMTVLHGLYREGREPFDWVLETVRKRRFVAFLRWLAASIPDAERAVFRRSADALRATIVSFDGAPPFPDPFDGIA